MSLDALLADPAVSIAEIGAWLDKATPEERWAALDALSGRQIGQLYARAEGAAPLDLEYFVPKGTPALTEVIHDGKNSLPAFRLFQKRFALPESGEGRLFGYNEGSTRPWIGPGCFVAHLCDSDVWRARGAVVIDYFLVPDGPLPAGWPAVVPNSRGLQFFVYHHMRDFMRRVSSHVSVGRAFKNERPMGAYFLLCRREG